MKPGTKVKRGNITGVVTKVAPGGHSVMVRVGRRTDSVMRLWPIMQCEKVGR